MFPSKIAESRTNMQRWDIFCRVVDNYGDIGTCWRLARQLADEHQADVRLWVDQLQTLARLCPAVSPTAERQRVGQIEVCRWRGDLSGVEAADVVVEAFACELPESYLTAMARRNVAPVWINLEYLSAEEWVEGCHRLPSPRPRRPRGKYFFFPGFTPRTGGLLRERNLSAEREAFDGRAEGEFWHSVGVPDRSETELRVSMFCYTNASLAELLRCWAEGRDAVTVLATPGPAGEQVAAWFGRPWETGMPLRRSGLTAWQLPMLSPSGFDRLLWACDVNFVRGEDSFVRAQWARRPFVWQPYPQTEESHNVKLDAFLGRYLTGFEKSAVVRRCWHAWNGRGDIASAWAEFVAHRKDIERHAGVWANTLDQMGDLADNLARFVREVRDKDTGASTWV
jgi:uncharacterized repeat protein (TIGR03837 family)